ncbi:HYR domain-containing protein [Endozoicomonas sp. ALD040]|uniref:HYR domain-containing protein n=1 Tax=Endozoicomonas sp. ALD040 TaxID=3403079 RepID=UPI003BAED388
MGYCSERFLVLAFLTLIGLLEPRISTAQVACPRLPSFGDLAEGDYTTSPSSCIFNGAAHPNNGFSVINRLQSKRVFIGFGEAGVPNFNISDYSGSCAGQGCVAPTHFRPGFFYECNPDLGSCTINHDYTQDNGQIVNLNFSVPSGSEEITPFVANGGRFDITAPVFSGVPSDIYVTAPAGQTSYVVTFASPTATDNTDGPVTPTLTSSPTPGLNSGSAFPLGVTTLTYTATDRTGNIAAYSFGVVVTTSPHVDKTAPVFSGVPSNIYKTAPAGETSAVVTFTSPTATDDEDGPVTPTQTSSPTVGLNSGSAFPLGVTTLTDTATDHAGNVATCSFDVIVSASPLGSVTLVIRSDVDGTFFIRSSAPDLNTAIPVKSGSGSSGAIPLPPGSYPINFSAPDGIGVEGATCDNPSGVLDVQKQTGTLLLTSAESIVCTIDLKDSRRATTHQIEQFLEARSRLILQHQPDVVRRINRLENSMPGTSGIEGFGFAFNAGSLPFSACLGADRFSFAYSRSNAHSHAYSPGLHANLQQVLANIDVLIATLGSDQRVGRSSSVSKTGLSLDDLHRSLENPDPRPQFPTAVGKQIMLAANSEIPFKFDVWTEGQISRFNYKEGDGSFGVLHIGMDYLFQPKLLVGLSVQGDWTDLEYLVPGSEAEGVGFLVSPYLTTELSDNFYVDARAGWGKVENRISPFGTYRDSFDSERWLATAALIGTWQIQETRITPEARLSYYKEKSDDYLDSLNVAISSVEVETGVFQFGPTVRKDFKMSTDTRLSPFLTFEGIWTFKQKNSAPVPSGSSGLAGEGFRAMLKTGINLYSSNGVSFYCSAYYDGIGDGDFEASGLDLRFDLQF